MEHLRRSWRFQAIRLWKSYKKDFVEENAVKPVLARDAPEEHRQFLRGSDYQLKYLPYRWGLNDQGARGRDYGQSELIADALSQLVRF